MPVQFETGKVGDMYQIFKGGRQVYTPAGNPFKTKYFTLAQLVCDDINELGPDPTGKRPSYVSLHAGYCDFGRSVPKVELIRNLFIGYDPEWDIALAAGETFENLSNNPLSALGGESGFVIDPIIYFGQPVKASTIRQWLETQSRRALISVQTIGGNYQSILCSYRLLHDEASMPIESIVQGLVQYGIQFHIDQYLTDDIVALQNKIKELFIKAKKYASFADD